MSDKPPHSSQSPSTSAAASQPADGAWAADVCQIGVVLRAVLVVQALAGAALMFVADAPLEWLMRLAWVTAGVLPATLVWLLLLCALKSRLARLRAGWPQALAVLLGAVSGLFGCAVLGGAGFLAPAPWLASASSGALLAALLVAGLIWRARSRSPVAARAHLAELQARIRPHFLFNTLNSAIALVRAEPQRAERLLEDLSDLFRHALAAPGDSVALADELALAQRYLAIEQVRFGERMQVRWQIDQRAAAARLPPLLLQPLVENAVRHGVEPSLEAACIDIGTEWRGSTVRITIRNTVPAQAAGGQPGHGLALDNVRQRLQLLHDVQGRFQCGLAQGAYQVVIEVPA